MPHCPIALRSEVKSEEAERMKGRSGSGDSVQCIAAGCAMLCNDAAEAAGLCNIAPGLIPGLCRDGGSFPCRLWGYCEMNRIIFNG